MQDAVRPRPASNGMFLALLFLVILIGVAGVVAFSVYDKEVVSKNLDETNSDDFEIIEEPSPDL